MEAQLTGSPRPSPHIDRADGGMCVGGLARNFEGCVHWRAARL